MEAIKKFLKSPIGKLITVGVVGGTLMVCCLLIYAISSGGPTEAEPDLSAIQTQAVETALASLATPADAENVVAVPTNTDVMPTLTDIPTAAPTDNPNLIRPGTYIVGVDIQLGLFTGNAGDSLFGSCYWERLKDVSGNFDAILANDNSQGKFYVEVRSGDYALKTDCEMTYLGSLPAPAVEFPSQITAGTYLVRIDIQPGTYQGQAGSDFADSCYWERLSNVAGEFDGIIANDNAVVQYYVHVQPSDYALKTGCDLEHIGD